jgi:hypothetical protein
MGKNTKIVVGFLLFFSLNFSYGQVNITICNKSSVTLDSVVFHVKNQFAIGPIERDNAKTVSISHDQANFHSFVPFSISYFSSKLSFEKTWEKEWGNGRFRDSIYFFDHGISKNKQGIKRPDSYTLFVTNTTKYPIDSIFSKNNAIKSIEEDAPNSFNVELDHEKAGIDNAIFFKINNKNLNLDLKKTDFINWNEHSTFVYLLADSISIVAPKGWQDDFFILDFGLDYYDDKFFKHIKVKSKHLIKEYKKGKYYHHRAVFDYQKFIQSPRFALKIRNTKTLISFDQERINNRNHLYIFLSRKKKKISIGY